MAVVPRRPDRASRAAVELAWPDCRRRKRKSPTVRALRAVAATAAGDAWRRVRASREDRVAGKVEVDPFHWTELDSGCVDRNRLHGLPRGRTVAERVTCSAAGRTRRRRLDSVDGFGVGPFSVRSRFRRGAGGQPGSLGMTPTTPTRQRCGYDGSGGGGGGGGGGGFLAPAGFGVWPS